jgi:hypothetical protein
MESGAPLPPGKGVGARALGPIPAPIRSAFQRAETCAVGVGFDDIGEKNGGLVGCGGASGGEPAANSFYHQASGRAMKPDGCLETSFSTGSDFFLESRLKCEGEAGLALSKGD